MEYLSSFEEGKSNKAQQNIPLAKMERAETTTPLVMSQFKSQSSYAAVWRRYRRIARCGIFLIPGIWLLLLAGELYLPDSAYSIKMALMIVLACLWALALIVILALLYGFQCPKCNELFFVARFSGRLNPLANRCHHCGLPKWSEPDTMASNARRGD